MYEEKADMCFTDPPYGYEYQSNLRKKSKKFDVIENDDKILDFSQAYNLCVMVLYSYARRGKY